MRQQTIAMVLLAALLASCGATGGTAQQIPATPTPLPPNPALEKQTYPVKRGLIERALDITGRVTPVDLVALSFRVEGRLESVAVQRGDTVKAGDLLASLVQTEALDELRAAQDALAQRQRDLENARKTQARTIKERQRALDQANETLAQLLPGGENDLLRAAQEEAEKADRALRDTRDDQSTAKTDAEQGVASAADALVEAQRAWTKAYWNNQWVEQYGTDPAQPTKPDPDNPDRMIPNRLTPEQRQEFEDALRKAETALHAAERGVEKAKQSFDRAREDEVLKIREAERELEKKRAALSKLVDGKGSKELRDAQEAVESAREALEEASQGTDIADRLKVVEDAQRELEKKQKKVADGRLVAPRDGEVLSVRYAEGDAVQAFEPVLEIADPSKLEFAATLNGDQNRQLAEGQPAEIRLLSRPDVPILAVVRRLPGGPASGGTVADRDPTTRFEVRDAKGLTLQPTEVGRIRIVLERKEQALLLPPEAIRTFEGRRFVIVREGQRERRVTIRTGITTDSLVEILEGVAEGDVVVGP